MKTGGQLLFGFAEEGTGHPLVEQHGQNRYHSGFQQIQGRHTEENEGGYIVDISVDLGTHSDDGIQRELVKLGEFGQQINGIESRTENGDADAADDDRRHYHGGDPLYGYVRHLHFLHTPE